MFELHRRTGTRLDLSCVEYHNSFNYSSIATSKMGDTFDHPVCPDRYGQFVQVLDTSEPSIDSAGLRHAISLVDLELDHLVRILLQEFPHDGRVCEGRKLMLNRFVLLNWFYVLVTSEEL